MSLIDDYFPQFIDFEPVELFIAERFAEGHVEEDIISMVYEAFVEEYEEGEE